MKINDITSRTDVLQYVHGLCNKPYPLQIKEAKERIQDGTPLDFAVTDTTEAIIEQNADLIADYYAEYEAELENSPTQLKEFLVQRFGERVLAMVERNR